MNEEIELKVMHVFESQSRTGAYVLLLEKTDDDKQQIPIIIGEKEAHSIYSALNEQPSIRPLSHDILAAAIEFLEGTLSKIVIYKVNSGIYYSYLYLNRGEQFTRIDARTSDAVALALRLNTPIYILKEILDSENIEVVMDGDESFVIAPKSRKGPSLEDLKVRLEKAIEQENYELASVIRDQIAEIE